MTRSAFLLILAGAVLCAQTITGTIVGMVSDPGAPAHAFTSGC